MMKKLIFTNEISDEDIQAAKEFLEENEMDATSEEKIYEEASFQNAMWFSDEKSNLDIQTEGQIILIADLGLWHGRKQGYKIIGNNIKDILSSLSEGEVEFFGESKGRQIKARQSHHDGVNHITFREIKPDVNIDNLTNLLFNNCATHKDISRYTRSLYPAVASVYGW